MITPKDTDLFLVDIEHGIHYHATSCPAAAYPPTDYTELSYGEIRAIKTRKGESFEAHRCVSKRRELK